MADKPLLPSIIDRRPIAADEFQLCLAIDADLFWFDGHFPEAAILPGVVQMNWARQLGQELWPDCDWISQASNMEVVKFQQVIRPGECVSLVLKLDSAKRKLSFAYSDGERRFSSGRLVVAA